MSSSPPLETSCVLSTRLPARHLCLLDEGTLLFCLEGETDVFFVKISELKGEVGDFREHPEKTFCKVSYTGMPLVVKGGKMGRLVVVVPLEQDGEKVENWVVAPDCFSQDSVPSPAKGRWKTATVFKNSIHLCQRMDFVLAPVFVFVVCPAARVIPPNWASAPVSAGGAVGIPQRPDMVCSVHKCQQYRYNLWDRCEKISTGGTFRFEVPLEKGAVTLSATASRLCWLNYRGVLYLGQTAEQAAPLKCKVPEDTTARAISGSSEPVIFLGTATGGIYKVEVGNAKGEGQTVEKIFQASGQTDQKIESLVVMPGGDKIFSLGKEILIGKRVSSVKLPCLEISSVTEVMRRWVFEGGAGADVELISKEETCSESDKRSVFGLKGLLSDRCHYFKGLFSGGFRKWADGVYEFSDTSFEALRCVVLYLHTDVVELKMHFAVDVMELARQWEIPALQGEAEKFIAEGISTSNCTDVLLGAECRTFPDLWDVCVKFAVEKIQKDCATQEAAIKNWFTLLLETDREAERRGMADLRKHCISWAARNILKVRGQPDFSRLEKDTMEAIIQALR
uniref:BTB domain-containing protein n=1 Tax=Chromera velia CCMP2878 TaxID=1169474 RepID=A0A0G4GRT4_9ALVE|eukprot:Cvel_23101.t1-p1 / transcript=Cvel_23101.t1 / gene=Cvel_23101 / organism=Chromera_velia_CCMP2878 / gene_product=hypothetical protein / transcript_product=hypothetical protein / location=Cvel_scaffold2344:8311-10695(-) / protein_length=564 / sequence_SO=supercontig / SO=protein_coding / is_pseudo=false